MLTQERLKELFHYDPLTGVFTRLVSTRRVKAGTVAGTLLHPVNSRTAYYSIKIDGHNYYNHRLAYLYMVGKFPAHLLDHQDGNGLNNAYTNLRECKHYQNIRNTSTNSTNTSGVKNVFWDKSVNKWRGTFGIRLPNGKRQHINVGTFTDLTEAAEAVRLKRVELHGDFANHA